MLVPDVMEALAKLTRWQSAPMPGVTRIGLTGSSGKTSTKDLLAQTLSRAGTTNTTVGSQNNEIGVPMTVANCPADAKFLVAEMVARGPGHLTYLTDMLPLRIAVVLMSAPRTRASSAARRTPPRPRASWSPPSPPTGWPC